MLSLFKQLILIVISLASVLSNRYSIGDLQIRKFQNLLSNMNAVMPQWKPKLAENHAALIDYKMQFKNYILSKSGPPASGTNSNPYNSFLQIKRGYIGNTLPSTFFGASSYVADITKLPLTGAATQIPWSGSYWQMRAGLTSVRYDRSDRNTIGVWDPTSGKFTSYYIWSQSVGKYSQPAEHNAYFPNNIANYIDSYYSPAEKYDYLVGDYKYTLTNNQKKIGGTFAKNNDIPTWFGICHGWAAAAYYFPKPVNTVTLYASDGRTKIRFFPDDIKALASLFFANANYITRFVGDICPFYNATSTNSDPATGLFTDDRCFSVNPATFLLILGNQMGINRRNFILDTASDPEKWNQPVKSYSLGFFNILTNTFYSTAAEAIVPFSSISKKNVAFLDFLSRRAVRGTTSVVGVLMEVIYALESQPVRGPTPLNDFFETAQYVAAIELDRNNNIIGGEWMFNKHPNFAWKFDENSKPSSLNDNKVKFRGSVADLRRITPFAVQTSQNGQVLGPIVDYLVSKSRSG